VTFWSKNKVLVAARLCWFQVRLQGVAISTTNNIDLGSNSANSMASVTDQAGMAAPESNIHPSQPTPDG
jgi:hypothetical protein